MITWSFTDWRTGDPPQLDLGDFVWSGNVLAPTDPYVGTRHALFRKGAFRAPLLLPMLTAPDEAMRRVVVERGITGARLLARSDGQRIPVTVAGVLTACESDESPANWVVVIAEKPESTGIAFVDACYYGLLVACVGPERPLALRWHPDSPNLIAESDGAIDGCVMLTAFSAQATEEIAALVVPAFGLTPGLILGVAVRGGA